MAFKKIKIAVLMYGQIRTGIYCAPWIKSWFSMPTHITIPLYKQRISNYNELLQPEICQVEVDYFLDLKDKNTYANSTGVDSPDIDIQKIIDLYQPKKFNITSIDEELNWKTTNGLQNYASMFNSIRTCLRLKQQSELESGELYNFCFTHRYDAINGPDINSFRTKLTTTGFPPLTIISPHRGMSRWPWENWRMGPNDTFFGGDNLAVEILMAEVSKILFVNNNLFVSAGEWQGPNVILGRAINNSSLEYQEDMNFFTAMVRPNADLTKDVFESWTYHQEFWVRNHAALAQDKKILMQ